jgi:uncharacterized membrane protein
MVVLIAGLVALLGVHSIKIAAPGWRDSVVARYGVGPYKGAYSVVAISGLVLVIWGFSRTWDDPVFLYAPPGWGRHLVMTLMLPASILAFASVFPAGGIKRYVGHPLLFATMLWAAGHILANGDLGGVVLFAAFLVWSVADWMAQPGTERPSRSAFNKSDIAAVAVGLLLYVALIAGLHYWLFGVSPIV